MFKVQLYNEYGFMHTLSFNILIIIGGKVKEL